MANPSDVLYQLQSKLSKHFLDNKIEINKKEEVDEDLMNEFGLASNLTNRLGVDGSDIDVDDIQAVDTPYKTNMSIASADSNKIDPKKIKVEKMLSAIFEKKNKEDEDLPDPDDIEADETPMPEEGGNEELPSAGDIEADDSMPPPPEGEAMPPEGDVPPEGAGGEGTMPPPGEEMPAGDDIPPDQGGMGGDPSMMPPGEAGMDDMGGDPNMMGMEGEPAKKPSEIGRIYELKKIYARLTTIESYLSDTADTDLLRIRLLVSKAIELFEILSSNIPSYRPPRAKAETIDEIIVMYYKFLKQVYESVSSHYKKSQQNVLKTDNLKKARISLSKKELV